jgi:hypothetical protein
MAMWLVAATGGITLRRFRQNLLSPLLVIRMTASPDHRARMGKHARRRSPPAEKRTAATQGGTDDRKDQ